YGSISVLREELERGSLLGVKYLMTHLGSTKDLGEKKSLQKVVAGLEKILTDYQGSTQLLIEISSGSGAIIGDTFEEVSEIIKNCKLKIENCLGVCFDTAHAFESGYDLRDAKAVQKTFSQFDKTIGLKKLKLIHLNDSKTALGSHSDRHEDLGQGQIGLSGFSALIQYLQKKKLDIDLILETPTDSRRKKDITLLKSLRDN
ncbi:MAG TPA: deoxyribonuclease IV, partial [Patescibacteria group bacterium]|nr:deoxyribonuclease IV [Patescibacteria group bacterium]